MPSCATSVEHVMGRQEKLQTPYLVGLNEWHLDQFDLMNSMCLLSHYDQLLSFLERSMRHCVATGSDRNIVVPPYDVVVVLLTLGTLANYYKEPLLASNDPYYTSRRSLSKRCLCVLRYYVNVLQEFDVSKYDRYDLELLRCQMFLVVDMITPTGNHQKLQRFKRRKMDHETVVYSDHVVEPPHNYEMESFKAPYRSYINCLDRCKKIMGNILIPAKLNQPGEFINSILWCLGNSLNDDDDALYMSSHEVWTPLWTIITDIFELRHDYFIANEIERGASKALYVQSLSESPLASFFSCMNSMQFSRMFCENIFINCDHGNLLVEYTLHPLYHNENQFSNIYVPRIRFDNQYKIIHSMKLRRKFIEMCFKLLLDVPDGHRLVHPRIVADDLIQDIASILSNLKNMTQFKAFFYTEVADYDKFYFIPLLAEETVSIITKKLEIQVALQLADNLWNSHQFIQHLDQLTQQLDFTAVINKEEEKQLLPKLQVCIIVLCKYLIHLNGNALDRSRLYNVAQKYDANLKAANYAVGDTVITPMMAKCLEY